MSSSDEAPRTMFPEDNDEEINNPFQEGHWLEVKDTIGNWEPATVIAVKGNWIKVHYENWSAKWDENLHAIRHKERLRDLGATIPESEQEKIKREEMANCVQILQEKYS